MSLSEVPGIVRCGDRVRLKRALHQLQDALASTADLDEARGEALMFISVVCAATMEMGASRAMHMVQLVAARSLDECADQAAVAELALDKIQEICEPLFAAAEDPTRLLIERTLRTINRSYADNITDVICAAEIGLSVSHFRFLFREVTGQPFGRYLTSVRLEKARRLLLEEGMKVSEVAAAVGFQGLAHFSRAFTQRFRVNPSFLRRGFSIERSMNS